MLLQLLDVDVSRTPDQIESLLREARESLGTIRLQPIPEPGDHSPAYLAFDPCIGRRLNTFVPLRVITPPPVDQTWNAMQSFLDGWYDLRLLAMTTDISTWEVSIHI